MLYNDRKMKKWQGFILSEHGASLAEGRQKNQRVVRKKAQQTEQEVGQIIEQSFRRQIAVNIQQNLKENDGFQEDLTGIIIGFEEGNLYLANGGHVEAIEIESIRNIESVGKKKWYQ